MKISELEPFVKSRGLVPMHLDYGKGGKVKWLVSYQEYLGGRKVFIHDAEGQAYNTCMTHAFTNDFFEKVYIWKSPSDFLVINGYTARKSDEKFNYHAPQV